MVFVCSPERPNEGLEGPQALGGAPSHRPRCSQPGARGDGAREPATATGRGSSLWPETSPPPISGTCGSDHGEALGALRGAGTPAGCCQGRRLQPRAHRQEAAQPLAKNRQPSAAFCSGTHNSRQDLRPAEASRRKNNQTLTNPRADSQPLG